MNQLLLKQQLSNFLQEDIGYGDQTSQAIFEDEWGEAEFLAKEPGIFCGEKVLQSIYELVSGKIELTLLKSDGDLLESGEIFAKVSGPIVDLLSTERVALNLIQRLSGIATKTAVSVSKVKETETKICDTRKTTPGLRMLEKYAVRCGGGWNHRFGLDDAILIKDNHITQAGSVTRAVTKVKQSIGHMRKIEVEIENLLQLDEAIKAGVDVIMLDNCSVEEATTWCKMIPSHITTEVSGGMTEDQLEAYAKAGVDYISMGALTHSATALDISFNVSVKEGVTNAS
ncbi:carboxylating nicotinate-nucleotide diphosphorylase [Salipaludibacillus sp. CF4.18]|uniref:carboxylating nicotinate-nucleotide diphosphorylase n=1 Tax=Salipaludibacillus sp. CF4.18 TaxID=3373081 RepID=UPI003EE4803D